MATLQLHGHRGRQRQVHHHKMFDLLHKSDRLILMFSHWLIIIIVIIIIIYLGDMLRTTGRSPKVTTRLPAPCSCLVTPSCWCQRPFEADGTGICRRQIKDVSRLGCDWQPRRQGRASKEPFITSCFQLEAGSDDVQLYLTVQEKNKKNNDEFGLINHV